MSKHRNDKKDRRGANFRKRLLRAGTVLLALILALGLAALVGKLGTDANFRKTDAFPRIDYGEDRLVPETDAFGNVSFTCDRALKIVQLTDVHLGCGCLSLKKDEMAMNCVAAMLTAEKPDLVIVTGDVAYPVPFQSGSIDNRRPAQLFASLMERLGVYWTLTFGNHDTEAYSLYDRREIAAIYESDAYPHCLFQSGPADVDGYGNQIITVKNSDGVWTQVLYLFDSHAYIEGDTLGLWKYDNIHENQIAWYEENVRRYQKAYEAEGGKGTLPSLAFFHIPLKEYRDAWYELLENKMRDTKDVAYVYGAASDSRKIVYCGVGDDDLFETALRLGSTKGFFCGHDHYNWFSVDYKGVRLTYGKSVDYLAMPGICRVGAQRGCTVITLLPDGSFLSEAESYYQKKYASVFPKEDVLMQYDPQDFVSDPKENNAQNRRAGEKPLRLK